MRCFDLRGVLVLAILGGLVAGLLSCGKDTCGPKEETDPSRDTPEHLLAALAESFQAKRADWYDACLAEDFTFELTPEDAESFDLSTTEPWLDRSADLAAVSALFGDEHVEDIHFSFESIGDPVEQAGGTRLIRTQPDVKVNIACDAEEPFAYWVNDSCFDFTLEEDPADSTRWVIHKLTEIRIDEQICRPPKDREPGMAAATYLTTLGMIMTTPLKAPTVARTADQALEDYAAGIEARDILTYGDCLDYDHTFIFTDDVADSLRLPPDAPWWDKAQDLEAMAAMFSHPYVSNISFDYIVADRETTGLSGVRKIKIRIIPDARLTFEAPGEEPTTYWAAQEYMDFVFMARGFCSDRWTVASIEEVPLLGKSDQAREAPVLSTATSSPSTWGMVKAMFRP
jgi:hypothetical protein